MHKKSWSLVGIFNRSSLLFLRGDEKTLLVLPCLDRIFGNMLQFFVFISTCKSWQPILKRSKSLCRNPNLGLTTKARGDKVAGQEGDPGALHMLPGMQRV